MIVPLLWLLTALVLSSSLISVTVDPTGGDDAACLSIVDLIAANLTSSTVPCRSINRVLGNSGEVSACERLNSSWILASSGILSSLGILASSGILDGVEEEVAVVLAKCTLIGRWA